MPNRFIFFSYFPSSSLLHSRSCHAQSLPLDDSSCHGLKPQLSHTEMSFWGKFVLWRGGSNVPLKLPALWVRKYVLCRSLVKLSHLYAQLSGLGCRSAADTGTLCRGRVQLQGQELKFGKYLCYWLCVSQIHFREKDMKLIAPASSAVVKFSSPVLIATFLVSRFTCSTQVHQADWKKVLYVLDLSHCSYLLSRNTEFLFRYELCHVCHRWLQLQPTLQFESEGLLSNLSWCITKFKANI